MEPNFSRVKDKQIEIQYIVHKGQEIYPIISN